jgi:protein-disulfide isomerase
MASALAGMLLVLATGLSTEPAAAQAVDEALRKEIEALKEGQAAIRKELQELKDLLRGRQASQSPVAPVENVALGVHGAPALGDGSAKVTLVEFSDYQCPFCQRHSQQTLPAIVNDYVKTGKVRYVFRDFPIASLHPQAARLHQAAYCAGDQNKYWEMHDQLFASPPGSEVKDLVGLAQTLGLNIRPFEECLAKQTHAAKVQQGVADGLKAGVRGTPTFFLGLTEAGGAPVKAQRTLIGAQPYQAFREAIEGLLAGAK